MTQEGGVRWLLPPRSSTRHGLEQLLQADDPKWRGGLPIVLPAYDVIAVAGIVPVVPKVAAEDFDLDRDAVSVRRIDPLVVRKRVVGGRDRERKWQMFLRHTEQVVVFALARRLATKAAVPRARFNSPIGATPPNPDLVVCGKVILQRPLVRTRCRGSSERATLTNASSRLPVGA